MSASVALALLDASGRRHGTVVLSEPAAGGRPLRDRTADLDRPASAPLAEVSEAAAYWYEVVLDGDAEVERAEPAELLEPHPRSPATGRLWTGQSVGEVRLQFTLRDGGAATSGSVARGPDEVRNGPLAGADRAPTIVSAAIDVRPSKLADEGAFRAMLKDLAELSVELLHRGFAPSAGRYRGAGGEPARLGYQRFALVHAQLFDPELERALARVVAEPHHEWRATTERRRAGAPLKGSSRLARSLTRPGPRASAAEHLSMTSVPRLLEVDRTDSTLDNLPNRYVRFVLERWRAVAADALDAIERGKLGPAARRRGRAEAERVLDRIDELLGQSPLREAGPLRAFPQGNQVLLKRDGYRQIAAAAAIVEASLGLGLELDDPLLVSRHSIDQLYEWWCFVQVAEALGRICGGSRAGELFELSDGGMSLRIKRGADSQLAFATTVGGRRVHAQLFFHRGFRGRHAWARPMDPDCSLLLRAGAGPKAREWWLHFDPKYRLELPGGGGGAPGRDAGADAQTRVKGEDLVAMHAYRDGIRDSAAAFVLFPGERSVTHRLHDELLPAVGGFPLRPGEAGADGLRLERFLVAAFEHVANEASKLERARYWSDLAYGGGAAPANRALTRLLERPPADAAILLGYVRSARQRDWIETKRLYNLRGDDRRGAVRRGAAQLDAEWVVLYGGGWWRGPPVLCRRTSPWQAKSGAELNANDYPAALHAAYFCCSLVPLERQPRWMEALDPAALLPPRHLRGAPFSSSWLDVMLAVDAARLTPVRAAARAPAASPRASV